MHPNTPEDPVTPTKAGKGVPPHHTRQPETPQRPGRSVPKRRVLFPPLAMAASPAVEAAEPTHYTPLSDDASSVFLDEHPQLTIHEDVMTDDDTKDLVGSAQSSIEDEDVNKSGTDSETSNEATIDEDSHSDLTDEDDSTEGSDKHTNDQESQTDHSNDSDETETVHGDEEDADHPYSKVSKLSIADVPAPPEDGNEQNDMVHSPSTPEDDNKENDMVAGPSTPEDDNEENDMADGPSAPQKDNNEENDGNKDRNFGLPHITAANAQSLLSPDAVVFVANLPQHCDDAAIEDSLHATFDRFGECWIKVRRNPANMPVAFVQYRDASLSSMAIAQGRGAYILGRPCRTEQGRVHRVLYVSRNDEKKLSYINIQTVTNLAAAYGAIETRWLSNPLEAFVLSLKPGGMFIKFTFFQDCENAVHGLRRGSCYRWVKQPVDHEHRIALRIIGQVVNQVIPVDQPQVVAVAQPPHHPAAPWLEHPQNAIYLGNLPIDITKHDLAEIFGIHGGIVKIEILHKTKANGLVETYAYVWFARGPSTWSAVCVGSDNLVIGGRTIRVDWKKSPERASAPAPVPAVAAVAAVAAEISATEEEEKSGYSLVDSGAAAPEAFPAGSFQYTWKAQSGFTPRTMPDVEGLPRGRFQ